MTKEEELAAKAKENFKNDYNCAESMFKAYLNLYGKNEELISAATCFGGGLAGTKKVCGAITGSFIAIGLEYSRQKPEEKELQAKIRKKALELMRGVEEDMGSIYCKDYVTYDLTTQEGRDKLHSDEVMRENCRRMLNASALRLAEALKEKQA